MFKSVFRIFKVSMYSEYLQKQMKFSIKYFFIFCTVNALKIEWLLGLLFSLILLHYEIRGAVLWKTCSKTFRKIHRHTLLLKHVFRKVVSFKPEILFRNDSGKRVFQGILRNIQEHLFCRLPEDHFFLNTFKSQPAFTCSKTIV